MVKFKQKLKIGGNLQPKRPKWLTPHAMRYIKREILIKNVSAEPKCLNLWCTRVHDLRYGHHEDPHALEIRDLLKHLVRMRILTIGLPHPHPHEGSSSSIPTIPHRPFAPRIAAGGGTHHRRRHRPKRRRWSAAPRFRRAGQSCPRPLPCALHYSGRSQTRRSTHTCKTGAVARFTRRARS